MRSNRTRNLIQSKQKAKILLVISMLIGIMGATVKILLYPSIALPLLVIGASGFVYSVFIIFRN